MDRKPSKESGISKATRNFRIAELINKEISQPVSDVTAALVLAGKSENEVQKAAEITARVILKTLTNHLVKDDQS
ncbi:cellulose biosynthesis cyclic di-GMP-binding regulatory protein BcsB [Serratia symbiotica]|uniref:cellulose biosynthesis cyclic di-GMP-binding regulatory protein BcsB n=1 Tax=Serratia symbiotica TaxID=138074 RepID=UPI001CF09B44|nr:cellulose biosynthesis cyclic di-GMP-binding regulatory protein BcsB [Serratia symbiotica]